ncbi:MAG: linear amide C-N hydrolase [Candidatus Aminicenantes bacterium]|nr:linear amide C-N hydrolase [Candidatus Aminicenantes bacterium]
MNDSQHKKYIFIVLLLAAIAFLVATLTPWELEFTNTVVAGSLEHFAEVRHVIIKGSNFEIGKKLAEIAKNHGTQMQPAGDPLMNKVKREYMKKNDPILFDRMRGIAEAFEKRIDDNAYDFTGLPYLMVMPPGCSVVFYPKSHTKSGHSILSRNYEFTTGTIEGRYPKPGELPVMARPYLIELHPDQGYSSLALHNFDLLSGVIDGINSEGLTVAILAEEESLRKFGHEPGNEAGFAELSAMRYLLDNCKNVQEAKEAMLSLKHFYGFIPCHYIIGDLSGKSFIFEFSPNRNRSYIIDGNGPQCITNHLVFHHRNVENLDEKDSGSSLRRYKILHESISENKKFSPDEIEGINNLVAVPPKASSNPDRAPGRTLWYAQYDMDSRTLTVRFYLGEKPDPEDKSKVVLEYSSPRTFKLLR